MEDSDIEMAKKLGGKDLHDTALRVCAIREVLEETGILLTESPKVLSGTDRRKLDINDLRNSIDSLFPVAVWKTPVELAMHAKGGFETSFFLAITSNIPTFAATPDGEETDDLVWLKPSEALDNSIKFQLPMPQLYITTELSSCYRHNELQRFVLSLRHGIFKYPFWPSKIDISQDEFAFVLPGDAEHHTFKPMRGQRWKHRGVYSSHHGQQPAWRLERSDELRIEAGRAAETQTDWCKRVPIEARSNL